MTRRIFNWIFKSQIDELNQKMRKVEVLIGDYEKRVKNADYILDGISVSVDAHENPYSRSWAAISIQGSKQDYIKFVDLGAREIKDIAHFLRRFEKGRRTVDASPRATNFLKFQVD